MNIAQIKSRIGAIDTDMRRMHDDAGNAAFTGSEQTRWDSLEAERAGLVIQQRQAVGAIAANPANREAGHDGSDYDRDPLADPASAESFRGSRNPWQLGAIQEWNRSRPSVAAEYRGRALDAVDKMPGANDKMRGVATSILEQSDDQDSSVAKLILATSSPEYFRGWVKMARGAAHELLEDERRAIANAGVVQRAMSLTDNVGGYLVPFQLDPTLIITSAGSRNQIREVARKVIATGDVWHGVTSNEISWSWDAEAAEVSDDTPSLTQPSVQVHMARGFVPISIEALADASNVTQEVGRLFAQGKDTLESTAFAVGSGVGQPQGVVTGLTGTSSVVASTSVGAFAVGDLYKLEEALPARMRTGATWLGSKPIYNDVRQFGVSDGHALWERIGAGQPAELLGYPALEAEAMAATTVTGAKPLVLGEFGDGYVIVDRLGVTSELVPHLFGANGRPTGQRGFFAYYRTGAGVVNTQALRMLQIG